MRVSVITIRFLTLLTLSISEFLNLIPEFLIDDRLVSILEYQHIIIIDLPFIHLEVGFRLVAPYSEERRNAEKQPVNMLKSNISGEMNRPYMLYHC